MFKLSKNQTKEATNLMQTEFTKEAGAIGKKKARMIKENSLKI